MKVTISPGEFDAITEWLLANGFELTRANWIEANWCFDGRTEADLQAEELAEIPDFLLPKT